MAFTSAKVAQNLRAFKVCCLKITPSYEPCRTLWGLSKMVLGNVRAFSVLKVLDNLVSMQKSLSVNNYWNK